MREIKLIRGLNEETFEPTIAVYLGDVFTGIKINIELCHDLSIYAEPHRSELITQFIHGMRDVVDATIPDITEEEFDAIKIALKL